MIALYERLSLADDDGDWEHDESNSIVNQRQTLYAYIQKNGEIKRPGEAIVEFVDDGYTGTRFDRPGFNRMMTGIKAGTIQTVLVKDFSRLGRNYIDVGDFTERIFPMMGVRLIAVNDGYDSDKAIMGDGQDLEFVVKNILNAYYSRDLSLKISSIKGMQINQGIFVGGCAPMGYDKDRSQPHRLVVDEAARPYIRRIFELAIEGQCTSAIAKTANVEGIPTPNQYLVAKGVRRETKKQPVKTGTWNREMVTRIIKNPLYMGTAVGHKSVLLYPCSGKVRQGRPREQVRVERAHPAIVSDEEYTCAQLVLRKQKSSPKRQVHDYLFKGKVYCGGCHRAMVYGEQVKAGHFFKCKHYTELGKASPCVVGKVSESMLIRQIHKGMQAYYTIIKKAVDVLVKRKQEHQKCSKDWLRQIADYESQISQAQSQKIILYEAYVSGRLSKEYFIKENRALTEQIWKHRDAIAIRRKWVDEAVHADMSLFHALSGMMDDINQLPQSKELCREAVDIFVERIDVFDLSTIKIQWRYWKKVQAVLQMATPPE